MWPTMLSFHWSIRHQQLMTSAGTCLKMVARASHFVTVRCEIAAACCLLKRSTFGGFLHFTLPSSVTEKPATCVILLLIEKVHLWCGICYCDLSNLLQLSSSLFNAVKRWKPLDAVWLVIHANAVDSLCRMIKMHALSIQLFQSSFIQLVCFSSFDSENILNFQFRMFACSLISSKRIELQYPRMCFSKICRLPTGVFLLRSRLVGSDF
jgi:hypothetical protein